MRPRLQTIALTDDPSGSRVEVRLDLPGHPDLHGEATGGATELAQAGAAAHATLRALAEVLPDVRLTVDDVVAQTGGDATWVTVLVTALGSSGIERLVGSALVEAGMHRAAVHATLHACNRRLLHLGVTPPVEATPRVVTDTVPPPSPRPGVRDTASVLLGYLRLLRRHVDELDDRDRLTLLDRSIVAADRLVDAADPDVQGGPRPDTVALVQHAVAGAVADVAAPAGDVVAHCPPDLHASADPGDLRRMLATGIATVLHHGTRPATVRAVAADPWVHIEVHGTADDPQTEQPDRDLRHSMRAGRDPGPGLALVRVLAEASGGTAAIESDGTHLHRVRLRVPLADPPRGVQGAFRGPT